MRALEVEVLNVMGIVYYRQRKNSRAAGFFNQALQTATKSGVPADFAELLNNLGNAYQAQHKYAEAETLLKQALKRVETEAGPTRPDLTFTLSSLGTLYMATGRYTEAEEQYQRALTILEPKPRNLRNQDRTSPQLAQRRVCKGRQEIGCPCDT